MDTVKRVREVPIEVRDMVRRVLLNHVGQANAISRPGLRYEVAARLGLNGDVPKDFDRTCRRALAWLRRNDQMGKLIYSPVKGHGYCIAGSEEEFEAYLAREHKRAMTILSGESAQRKGGLEALRALPLEQGQLGL